MRAGVLALQGDFAEHAASLERAGAEPVEVRLPRDLDGVEAILIPGGESTTISRLLQAYDLHEPLRQAILGGLPAWGTCAGMILLAQRVITLDRPTLGLLDITIRRNAYGRQIDSFEADLDVPALGGPPFRATFIRAPIIEDIGDEVEVLAETSDGHPVAVRSRHILATSFHPELGDDPRWHRFFVEEVARVAV
jgi:5'-phosphate synthase pdxT subunit